MFVSKLKGELFVDIGAHIGFYSLLLSRNFKRIVAFEPEHSNIEVLRRNARILGANNILSIEKAFCDRDGKVQLNLSQNSAWHSILGSSKNVVIVSSCSLASFFKRLLIK